MSDARRFPRACVASPHHLASAAGHAVLASGGNAIDAAVATNLVLGVVTPYLCGYGGDLFALVWTDRAYAYNGSGRSPAAATTDAVRDAVGADAFPFRGPHTVTVPGAVDGWFALLERFGTRSFASLAATALTYARDGFPLSDAGAESIQRSGELFGRDAPEWTAIYGGARPGSTLRQPALARTIQALRDDGPDAYYRGPIGRAIAEHLERLGSLMAPDDLADHHGECIEPISARYRDIEVMELPPNTQGVTALEALRIVDRTGALPPDGTERQHLLIEATKLALADRDEHVTDPDHMRLPVAELLTDAWADDRLRLFDARRAASPPPGRPARGGTAYLCAADSDGMLVSLIQSNYAGFGSGITVPDWGINLHNRGAFFSLDPAHANAIAPRKRTLHTLIPALALRDGRPWLVFGTMGGDGQAQTHLQLLARIVDDGEDIQRAITAPRWVVSPEDWSVTCEGRFSPHVLDGLRERGHDVIVTQDFDSLLGHAHAIVVNGHGYAGATDPRTEGAVIGL